MSPGELFEEADTPSEEEEEHPILQPSVIAQEAMSVPQETMSVPQEAMSVPTFVTASSPDSASPEAVLEEKDKSVV